MGRTTEETLGKSPRSKTQRNLHTLHTLEQSLANGDRQHRHTPRQQRTTNRQDKKHRHGHTHVTTPPFSSTGHPPQIPKKIPRLQVTCNKLLHPNTEPQQSQPQKQHDEAHRENREQPKHIHDIRRYSPEPGPTHNKHRQSLRQGPRPHAYRPEDTRLR